VIAVFGSAGLRDREKRRLMAAESARLADISILTAEDPRTESLNQILAEMAAAAAAQGGVEGQNFFGFPTGVKQCFWRYAWLSQVTWCWRGQRS
jgi:UDP-N-acetylmuramoyl-L-alanyl-D-glutamate--2,6-diaminopimelate ligase